jgi:hypothetical protein
MIGSEEQNVLFHDLAGVRPQAHDSQRERLAHRPHANDHRQFKTEANRRLADIEKEQEDIRSADYNKTTLTRLTSGAHSPEVRAECTTKT